MPLNNKSLNTIVLFKCHKPFWGKQILVFWMFLGFPWNRPENQKLCHVESFRHQFNLHCLISWGSTSRVATLVQGIGGRVFHWNFGKHKNRRIGGLCHVGPVVILQPRVGPWSLQSKPRDCTELVMRILHLLLVFWQVALLFAGCFWRDYNSAITMLTDEPGESPPRSLRGFRRRWSERSAASESHGACTSSLVQRW